VSDSFLVDRCAIDRHALRGDQRLDTRVAQRIAVADPSIHRNRSGPACGHHHPPR
jgi:hypothetical protein